MVKVGDRVFAMKEHFKGTVVFVNGEEYHIKRDDGVKGGGINGTWLAKSWEFEENIYKVLKKGSFKEIIKELLEE